MKSTNGVETYLNEIKILGPEKIRSPDGDLRLAYKAVYRTAQEGGDSVEETHWLDGSFRLVRTDICVRQSGECILKEVGWPAAGALYHGVLWPLSVGHLDHVQIGGRDPQAVERQEDTHSVTYSTSWGVFHYRINNPIPHRIDFRDEAWEAEVTLDQRGNPLPGIPPWPQPQEVGPVTRPDSLFPGAGRALPDLPYPPSQFLQELVRQEAAVEETLKAGGCVSSALSGEAARAQGPLAPLQATSWDVKFLVREKAGDGGEWTVRLTRSETGGTTTEEWAIMRQTSADDLLPCEQVEDVPWPPMTIQEAIDAPLKFGIDLEKTPFDFWFWRISPARDHLPSRESYLILMKPSDLPEGTVAYQPLQLDLDPATGLARSITLESDQWESFEGRE